MITSARTLLFALAWMTLTTTCVGVAHAHGVPAVPPEFGESACIVVLDREDDSPVHVSYAIANDDAEIDPEDVPLPDTKSHQFFALAGGVVPFGQGYRFFPFEGDTLDGIQLPLWIDTADVKRAQEALDPNASEQVLAATDIDPEATLVGHPQLEGLFQRVTADDARIPITMERAALGFDWDLSGLAPGSYVLAGYVFSPPSNGWSGAPGVFKLVSGDQDPPAATLDSVKALVLGGQGLPLSGCIDAPDGSTYDIAYRILERTDGPWVSLAASWPVTGGGFEHCFLPPPDISGSARFRVTVTSPDGRQVRAYSPDTATLLGGAGGCTASGSVCCDGAQQTSTGDDGEAPTGRADDAGAEMPSEARNDVPNAEPESEPDGSDDDPTGTESAVGGCAVTGSSGAAREGRRTFCGCELASWVLWVRRRRVLLSRARARARARRPARMARPRWLPLRDG